MAAVYSAAPEVARIASELIPAHHPHLAGIRIEYAFREGDWKSQGLLVRGKCYKLAGHTAFLITKSSTDTDMFAIIINGEEWAEMTGAERRALVDHELSHAGIEIDEKTGMAKLTIVGHDVEEFTAIVERHGLWKDSLIAFGKAVQLALDLQPAAA